MRDTGNRAEVTPVEAWPAGVEWKGEVLRLEPAGEPSALTVCDNTMDLLPPDQGPAKFPALALAGFRPDLPRVGPAGPAGDDAAAGEQQPGSHQRPPERRPIAGPCT